MQPESEEVNSELGDCGFEQKMDEYWNRLTGYMCRPKSLLALVIFVFIATRLWLLFGFQAIWPDTALYYAQYARTGVDCKQVAYRDFVVEYPPVAWWLMAVPRLIDSTDYSDSAAPPEVVKRYFDGYLAAFHAEMFLVDTACLVLMFLIGRRMLPAAQWVLPAAYALLTIVQPHLLYDRLDIGLLLFFLLCIYCWVRSLDATPAANLWAASSYLFLGLGMSFKIMPVIFVPFLLLADLWAAGSVWRFAGRALVFVAGAAGPFMIHIPSAGWGVFTLFRYHSDRGIHLESIWGSIMLVAAKFGVPCVVVFAHSAYGLSGEWSNALKSIAGASMLAMATFFGLWALLRAKRFDRRLALDTAQLVLVNSTVLSHVYSPQYLNWLLPLALLLALNIFPRNWIIWCGFTILVVAIVGISSWLYPHHYLKLTELQALPVALSVTRSACLVGLALLLNIGFFAKYGLLPWRTISWLPDAVAVAA